MATQSTRERADDEGMNRRLGLALLALALVTTGLGTALVGPPGAAASNAPSNDDFVAATPIASGNEYRYDLTGATLESGEGTCYGDGHSVWFDFDGEPGEAYIFYTAGSSAWPNLSFGAGAGPAASPICEYATHEQPDPMTFPMSGDQRIRVSRADVDGLGDATGRIGVARFVDAEDTDDFADAAPIALGTGPDGVPVANVAIDAWAGLTSQAGEGEPTTCHGEDAFADSTWFTFTPPAESGIRSWEFEYRLISPGHDEWSLGVFEGTELADLTSLGCSTFDSEGWAPPVDTVVASLEGGRTYHLRIGQGPGDGYGYPELLVRIDPAVVRADADIVVTDGWFNTDLVFGDDGEPIIVTEDESDDTLAISWRVAGTWHTETITDDGDTDWASEPHVINLAASPDDAVHAIAFRRDADLYVVRGRPGAWDPPVFVDGDVGDVFGSWGASPSMVELPDGRLAVLHGGDRWSERSTDGVWASRTFTPGSTTSSGSLAIDDAGVLHAVIDAGSTFGYVRSTDGGATWSSTETIADHGGATGRVALAPDGTVWVLAAAGDSGFGLWKRDELGTWTGQSVDLDGRFDLGRASEGGPGHLYDFAVDRDGHPVALLGSQTYAGLTLLRRTGPPDATTWQAADVIDEGPSPRSDWFGLGYVYNALALRPDGRAAAAFGLRNGDGLVAYAEDFLAAEAGADLAGEVGQAMLVDGGASTNGRSDIASHTWLVPDGCEVDGGGTTSPSAAITCENAIDGTVYLTVTDQEGWSHTDALHLEVAAAPEPDPEPTPPTEQPPTTVFECDPTAVTPFVDLPSEPWAREAIGCIHAIGVTTGTSPTTFSPHDHVTRAQMAAFLTRLYEAMTGDVCVPGPTPFIDLPSTTWASTSIACIWTHGLTTGTTATTFSPNDQVTRMQMITFLDRLWEAIHGDLPTTADAPFDDLPGNYADAAISRAYWTGLTTGTTPTTFSPTDEVTRMQMAAFLARFYEADPNVLG